MAYLNDGAIYEELMLEDPRDPNEHSSDEDDVVITDNVQEDLNSVHSDTELQDDLQNSELISEKRKLLLKNNLGIQTHLLNQVVPQHVTFSFLLELVSKGRMDIVGRQLLQ